MPVLDPFPEVTILTDWPSAVSGLPIGRYLVCVPVAPLLSGQDLQLTIHIVRGGDGPTLGLMAGVHGDETPGVRCLRDVLITLSPDTLQGTVVAVTVANPLAWQAQQRITPERQVDRANLARVFDTMAGGQTGSGASMARRLAAALERTFFAAITHFIDFHCYGRETMVRMALYRTDQTADALETSAAMTRAFGLGVYQAVQGGAGTTAGLTAARGIPTCVLEMGGTHIHRHTEDAITRLGTDGTRRVMQHLGMVESAPPGPDRQLVVDQVITIGPETSGYYLPEFDLEDLFREEHPTGIHVRQGQPLGQVFDTYTLECVETLTSPVDGFLVTLARGGPYQVGDFSLVLATGQLS